MSRARSLHRCLVRASYDVVVADPDDPILFGPGVEEPTPKERAMLEPSSEDALRLANHQLVVGAVAVLLELTLVLDVIQNGWALWRVVSVCTVAACCVVSFASALLLYRRVRS